MIKDFFRLIYASLSKRKLRSWLTMLGVVVGIAAVVCLIGLGQGLRTAVTSQFDFLTADVLTVQASGLASGPPGDSAVNPLKDKYVEEIERLTGVDIAIGRLIQTTKLEFNGFADFTFAASMPDREKRDEIERIAQLEIDQGRMLKDTDEIRVVLGNNYRKNDRFGIPVTIRDKVRVENKEFKVVGMLEKKGSFIIDNAILMNEDPLKDLFNVSDTYDIILVKVQKGHDINLVKERVEKYLRKERDVDEGEEDFTVESPEQAIDTLDATLFAVQLFVSLIAAISIVVGGLGIANTMYTSVLERTKEIGVMKSIGATNKQIFTLFALESGFLGAIGGFLGAIIGVSAALALAAIARQLLGTELIAANFNVMLIVGAIVFSFVIGAVSGVLPAYQASKLKPVEALQYAK